MRYLLGLHMRDLVGQAGVGQGVGLVLEHGHLHAQLLRLGAQPGQVATRQLQLALCALQTRLH
jgi:hypothetical protein